MNIMWPRLLKGCCISLSFHRHSHRDTTTHLMQCKYCERSESIDEQSAPIHTHRHTNIHTHHDDIEKWPPQKTVVVCTYKWNMNARANVLSHLFGAVGKWSGVRAIVQCLCEWMCVALAHRTVTMGMYVLLSAQWWLVCFRAFCTFIWIARKQERMEWNGSHSNQLHWSKTLSSKIWFFFMNLSSRNITDSLRWFCACPHQQRINAIVICHATKHRFSVVNIVYLLHLFSNRFRNNKFRMMKFNCHILIAQPIISFPPNWIRLSELIWGLFLPVICFFCSTNYRHRLIQDDQIRNGIYDQIILTLLENR